MPRLIAPLDAETRADFRRRPVLVRHRLAETGLFEPGHLAGLLESHPDDQIDLNLYDDIGAGRVATRTGARGKRTGAEILSAVQAGRMWVNVRAAERASPALAPVVAQIIADLKAEIPGFAPFKAQANLLISGPQARVPYHADPPDVLLLHILGRKRLWVYPNTEEFLSEQAFERIVLGETTEDMRFDPIFDRAAAIYDLEPGMGVAWPTNAPHRVENLGVWNVSLSIEYQDWATRLKVGAYYCNATLRRRFGLMPPPIAEIGPIGRSVRWALGQTLKRAGVNRAAEKRHAVDFDVAPQAAAGVKLR